MSTMSWGAGKEGKYKSKQKLNKSRKKQKPPTMVWHLYQGNE